MSKYTPISKIKLNPANPRIIRDAEYRDLVRSIAQFPKMLYKRGVVVDGNLMALGGNQRWRSILDILKMPESDLLELTAKQPDAYALWEVLREKKAVPAEWIVDGSDFTEEEIRRFIIVDNVQKGEHDWDALANGWDADELAEWGLRVPGWDEVAGEDENDYSKKVEAPIYEPKNEKPDHGEVVDLSRTNELIDEIEKADIPQEDKDFLKLAANRHLVFNYEKIADIYAHSSPEVQRLMENSALVIIDFDRAIELGYTELSDKIAELYGEEYPKEVEI